MKEDERKERKIKRWGREEKWGWWQGPIKGMGRPRCKGMRFVEGGWQKKMNKGRSREQKEIRKI